jgi:deazaflavin-dependent oxidoreductase (nitroreductase family)
VANLAGASANVRNSNRRGRGAQTTPSHQPSDTECRTGGGQSGLLAHSTESTAVLTSRSALGDNRADGPCISYEPGGAGEQCSLSEADWARDLARWRVTGRRSGRPRSTPVNPIEQDGTRWLVAPYGAVGWVRNVRASGEVELSHGRHSQRFRATEVEAEEAAPVLRAYVRKLRVVRPYFNARPDDPLDAFAAEAKCHPVFRLEPR